MASLGLSVRDSGQRGAITLWRYEVDHSEFTAAAVGETLVIDPIAETGQTFSGGGVIILDAWIQIQTLFAEPAAGAINLSFGVSGVGRGTDVENVVIDANVWQAQSGDLDLTGLTLAEKGVLLDDRIAGNTVWVDENVDMEVRLATTGPATVDETTAGKATLVVMYMQVPESE